VENQATDRAFRIGQKSEAYPTVKTKKSDN